VEPSVLLAIQHPLTALVTSAQLLEEDFEGLSPQQMRERIAAMHRGAFWLHELVENVLCAATIRDGHFHVRPQALRLEDVVEEISSVVTPILRQQGQQLHTFADDWTPEVLADPRRVGQALVNLISNASEHSADGSSVDVAVAAHGESVRVSVADRGPGLPQHTGNRLLEFFSRGAPAQELVYETTVLGLAVARWIIEAHGGRVGARNRRGGGAQFWFQLPTSAAAPAG
jgi:two-component system, OmpR family, sensor histidine kinase KdpD